MVVIRPEWMFLQKVGTDQRSGTTDYTSNKYLLQIRFFWNRLLYVVNHPADDEFDQIIEENTKERCQNNINWARELAEAGAHVIYGIAGLKIHSKALLVIRREERAQVETVLNSLEVEYREALCLSVYSGLSYQQIAEIQGVQEGTVKSRIFRAREKLRKKLQTGNKIVSDASKSVKGGEEA